MHLKTGETIKTLKGWSRGVTTDWEGRRILFYTDPPLNGCLEISRFAEAKEAAPTRLTTAVPVSNIYLST